MPGTHSYYLFVDKEQPVDWSEITKTAAHFQMRFRDSGVPLRPFYVNDDFWLWEAYGFLDTPLGRLKMGSVYRQFGLFWDDSWWGNVQYMDGLKLRSDYGLSLEDTPDFKGDFKIDRYFQFFIAQSRVSGAILGADSDSFAGSECATHSSPAWFPPGSSARNRPSPWALGDRGRDRQSADAYRVFDQSSLCQPWGPDHCRLGRRRDLDRRPLEALRRGLSTLWHPHSEPLYLRRPEQSLYGRTRGDHLHARPHGLSLRLLVRHYDNPYGRQGMFVPGITAKITSNVTLWFEYTYWNSHAGSPSQSSVLENGYQMVLDWHF